MTSRPKVNWRVPSTEWDRFVDYVHDKYGRTEGLVGREVDLAMREWIDDDGYQGIEERIDRLVRAAGRRPEDLAEKKRSTSTISDEGETTNVQCRVDPVMKEDFAAFTKEHSDDRLGVALARALRQRRNGGRSQRLEQKLDRIADDAEELLGEISDDDESETMNLRKKRTIKICRRFDGRYEITVDELHEAIADVAGETVIDDYEQRVLDRMGYARDPHSGSILVPIDEARRRAEEWDLPGPDAPAIDRKHYRDLSREEKVEGLRLELARKAYSRRGGASATVSKVHDGIFDGKGSSDHMRSLMDEAAEDDGYRMETSSTSGKEYITVNLDAVSHGIREQLRSESEVWSESEDGDTTDDQDHEQEPNQDPADESSETEDDAAESEIESDADDQMDALMNAQPARTDGGRDVSE